MKTALFTNFTEHEFTGSYDGKTKKFAPGQSVWMPDYLASHFAKHLVNRELLRTDANGNLIHKNGDKFTSPKNPEQNPVYMELFNKAFKLDEAETLGDQKDDIDTLINVANKNRQKKTEQTPTAKPSASTAEQNPNEPQVIVPPDFDEEDADGEDAFEGKPIEVGQINQNHA